MNTDGLLTVGALLLGFSLAGGFLITMTLGAIRRLRELPRASTPPDIEARLHRIEASVEAIRRDMDRLVEYQRLSALADAPRLGDRASTPRVNTPH